MCSRITAKQGNFVSSKSQNIPFKATWYWVVTTAFLSLIPASIIDQIMLVNKIIIVPSTAGWLLLECECLDWLQMLQYSSHEVLEICRCLLPPWIRKGDTPVTQYPPIQEKGTFDHLYFSTLQIIQKVHPLLRWKQKRSSVRISCISETGQYSGGDI